MAKSRFKTILLAGALALSLAGKLSAEEIDFSSRVGIDNFSPTEKILDKSSFDITQNGTDFDVGASLPIIKDWKVDINSKITDNVFKEISGAVINYSGKNGFYIGSSYKKFDSDSLLVDADMFKGQIGFTSFDLWNVSFTGAKVSIPNMLTQWYFKTPLELGAIGWDANLKVNSEIIKNKLNLSAWLSASGSIYIPNPEETVNLKIIKILFGSDDASFISSFNHIKTGLGVNVGLENFDFGLNSIVEGYPKPYVDSSQQINLEAGFHINENKINYNLTVNSITNYLDKSVSINLESNINGLLRLPFDSYLKGDININHSRIEESNIIIALGYSKNNANFEAFYNYQDKSLGFKFSTSLEK